MTIFFIRIDQTPVSDIYMSDFIRRSQDVNYLKNPFNIRIKMLDQPGSYVIKVKPIAAPFYYIGLLIMIPSFLIWGLNWIFFIGCLISAFGIFWTSRFYYVMIWLGLRKKGYKGKIVLVPKEEALEGIFWLREKS